MSGGEYVTFTGDRAESAWWRRPNTPAIGYLITFSPTDPRRIATSSAM